MIYLSTFHLPSQDEDEGYFFNPENKKNFAMLVKDSKFKGFLFNMWNKGRTFREDVENSCAIHPKYFRKMWEEYVSKY